MDDYLLLSGIQHFAFCRRQWALIHIEDGWEENHLTAEGRLLHTKAHDEHDITYRNGVISLRGLPVRSEKLGIMGTCDVVELLPCEEGITVFGREGRWTVHPVEYKRGKSKKNDCDRLQLAAECMCLEEMFSCQIVSASLYYSETRHRENVELDMVLRNRVVSIVSEMHEYYSRRYTPKVRVSKSCKNCSLANLCLPEMMRQGSKVTKVSDYINNHLRENEE